MTRMSPQNIERHIRALTEEIGVRLAGSAQEKQAADYVADQFEHPSLPGPHPRDPTRRGQPAVARTLRRLAGV